MVGSDAGHDIAAGVVVMRVDVVMSADRGVAYRGMTYRGVAMCLNLMVAVARRPRQGMMTGAKRALHDEGKRRRDRQTRSQPPEQLGSEANHRDSVLRFQHADIYWPALGQSSGPSQRRRKLTQIRRHR
jgi:hypothetical protein